MKLPLRELGGDKPISWQTVSERQICHYQNYVVARGRFDYQACREAELLLSSLTRGRVIPRGRSVTIRFAERQTCHSKPVVTNLSLDKHGSDKPISLGLSKPGSDKPASW